MAFLVEIFIPIINVIYLIITIKFKKVAMVSDAQTNIQSIKNQKDVILYKSIIIRFFDFIFIPFRPRVTVIIRTTV